MMKLQLFVIAFLGLRSCILGFVIPRPTTRTLALKASVGSSIQLIEPETGCEVVLLGCFHGSQSSAADVETCLEEKTDVIVLELCASRFADLRRDFLSSTTATVSSGRPPWISRFAKMVQKTAKSRGLSTGAAAAILGGVSGLQTALSGLQPGLEFTTALRIAMERESDIVLADQLVDETLHKIGTLPSISLSMWQDSFLTSFKENFGKEAEALNTALFGDGKDNQVTLLTFLTRNGAAIRDLFRLAVPPLIMLQTVVLGTSYAWSALLDQVTLDATESILVSSTATDTSSGPVLAAVNVFFAVLGYLSIALPATRVILRERDDCLTQGIQSACRLAAEQNPNGKGRVVAVLGLLHVNGVAKRLSASQPGGSIS